MEHRTDSTDHRGCVAKHVTNAGNDGRTQHLYGKHVLIEYAVQVQIDSDSGVSVPPDHKIPVTHGYRRRVLVSISVALV